ncbi:MAG: hypothetical protein IKV31_05555 [Paludibacteraceae bacterium]|nr:hypothetical protein [Paludibacteraceae bacterium]
MREEWLYRIALTWGNKTRPRLVRTLLDRYGSATEVIKHHDDMITNAAMEHV